MFTLLAHKKSIRYKLLLDKKKFEAKKDEYLKTYNEVTDKKEIIRYAEENPRLFTRLGISFVIAPEDSTEATSKAPEATPEATPETTPEATPEATPEKEKQKAQKPKKENKQ